MPWQYERGEGRFKHCWRNRHAGFVPSRRGAVGKCSAEITDEVAQVLLDTGVAVYEYDDDAYPSKIFNVHHGVIYEAVSTVPGRSYHGYPWRGQLPPQRVVDALERAATASGHLIEFKKCLKNNTK